MADSSILGYPLFQRFTQEVFSKCLPVFSLLALQEKNRRLPSKWLLLWEKDQ